MSPLVQHLLVPGVSLGEKLVRTFVVYLFLIIGLRLSGKRQLGQMNPFDLVVLLTLAITVQNALIGDDTSLSGGLIGATFLLVLNGVLVRFMHRRRALAKAVEGKPVVLIEDGQVVRENLDEELIPLDTLLAVCRQQGVERFDEVQRAVLETSGTISVFAKHPTEQEVTNRQLLQRLEHLETLLRERAAMPVEKQTTGMD